MAYRSSSSQSSLCPSIGYLEMWWHLGCHNDLEVLLPFLWSWIRMLKSCSVQENSTQWRCIYTQNAFEKHWLFPNSVWSYQCWVSFPSLKIFINMILCLKFSMTYERQLSIVEWPLGWPGVFEVIGLALCLWTRHKLPGRRCSIKQRSCTKLFLSSLPSLILYFFICMFLP